MYKEKIINLHTNDETWRNYTDAEIAEVEAAQTEAAQKQVANEAKAAEKINVLAKLGLTAEEAAALLS